MTDHFQADGFFRLSDESRKEVAEHGAHEQKQRFSYGQFEAEADGDDDRDADYAVCYRFRHVCVVYL